MSTSGVIKKPVFWIIAGTSEGRQLTEQLSGYDAFIYVSLATEYGKWFIEKKDNIDINSERLNQDEMGAFIQAKSIDCVIDTSHPYAQEVTRNISEACRITQTSYLRLQRPLSEQQELIYVEDSKHAAKVLEEMSGKVFLACGSKEVESFISIPNYADRCFLRVLPIPEILQKCLDLGFRSPNIIGMQGPFSKELNMEMLKSSGAQILVTKDSGDAGGFGDKIDAALELGVTVIVIGRPVEEGYTFDQVIQKLVVDYSLQK